MFAHRRLTEAGRSEGKVAAVAASVRRHAPRAVEDGRRRDDDDDDDGRTVRYGR